MKKSILWAIIISLFMMTAHINTATAADRYLFDKAHTQILFFVNHLGFSNSQGEFLKYDGYFEFDQENPEQSNVMIAIKTDSIDMDDAAWEKHLLSADFFNAEKFPTIVFKSTSIEVTGEKTGKLAGDLTILGVTKPVTLDVLFNKADIHPMSKNYVAGFSATAQLKRSDFGMVYALPMVGDDVSLRIEVEGIRQNQPNQ